jgi:arylesterase/paraoxonase
MKRRLLVVFATVLVVVGGWFAWLLTVAGELKTLAPHFDGTCTAVTGVIGGEDITIHPRTGVAYLSACDRFAYAAGRPGKGALYSYDLGAPSVLPVNLTPSADPAFCPHGLSLYVGPAGESFLFVINHAGGENTVEVYQVGDGGLVHLNTLRDPLLVSPNDLVAVSPTQVYITNDHRHREGFMRTVEDYLRRPWANVVMWDGKTFHEAAGGIRLANGINVSPDRKTVYVMSTVGMRMHVYDRDPGSGALALRGEIPLGSGVDNVEVDADGTLWIGAHPKLLTVVRYMAGSRPYAPSQVLHVVPRGGTNYRVDEVFLDRGERLSASSVAAVRGKRLLIGPVADSKFLDCQMR